MLVIVVSCESNDNRSLQNKPGAVTNQSSGKSLDYSPHPEWVKEKPSSSMRKAQYQWPGKNGAEVAEMAVFFFPGTGGSIQANLERWYGQFKQPDGSNTSDHAEEKKLTANELDVTITYTTGTFLKSTSRMMMGGSVEEMPGYAMLAAIVETSQGPWFFKATGPQETIDFWRDDFEKFSGSFKLIND
jgi:hypothetical protein